MPRNKVEDLFDYPQEYTKKVIDKNGYYKLNDLHKIYTGYGRSRIGQKPTDPPIRNADGFVISKDGVSCFSEPEKVELDKKNVAYVTREFPNVPHKPYIHALGYRAFETLFDKFLKEEQEKEKEEKLKLENIQNQ